MDPDTIKNYDATHMLIDTDNGQVLDFQGKKLVTNEEVSNGRDCFTVCFRTGGGNGGQIEKPIAFFRNPNSNYFIVDVPEDITGTACRTSNLVCMPQSLLAQYFSDATINGPLSEGKVRKLWVYRCLVHNDT